MPNKTHDQIVKLQDGFPLSMHTWLGLLLGNLPTKHADTHRLQQGAIMLRYQHIS